MAGQNLSESKHISYNINTTILVYVLQYFF